MTQSSQNLRIYIGQLTLSAWVEWKQILKLHKHLFPFHRAPFCRLFVKLAKLPNVGTPALLCSRSGTIDLKLTFIDPLWFWFACFFFLFWWRSCISCSTHWTDFGQFYDMSWVELGEWQTFRWSLREVNGLLALKRNRVFWTVEKILIAVLRWDFLSNGHHSWASHIENQ